MKIILGCDTGLHGAVCAYDASTSTVVNMLDMPIEPFGSKTHVDVAALSKWTYRAGADTIAIERVNAMPSIPDASGKRRGMGAASAFRFGQVYGEIRGSMVACGLKIIDVPPAQWKDLFELNKRDKDEGRQLAARLHPEAAHWLQRKKDQGRGEAILIARWAAQNRWENL